ncbi:MAG: FG-GAP repeat protein [Deltaproteobacteria bacterium]|nr:FG-GAP repeat protein [Deltaproteobacteria bacterium]
MQNKCQRWNECPYLTIGTPFADMGQVEDGGVVYTFIRSGAYWVQEAQLFPLDLHKSSKFGRYVDISGNTIVIGSRISHWKGAAYIYVGPDLEQ